MKKNMQGNLTKNMFLPNLENLSFFELGQEYKLNVCKPLANSKRCDFGRNVLSVYQLEF